MKLLIKDSRGLMDDKFKKFLIKQSIAFLQSNYKSSKNVVIENYLQKSGVIKKNGGTPITVREIVWEACENLVIDDVPNNRYELQVNSTPMLFDTDIKLIDACKLIEYGNNEVSGTGLFGEMFNYISSHLKTFYKECHFIL